MSFLPLSQLHGREEVRGAADVQDPAKRIGVARRRRERACEPAATRVHRRGMQGNPEGEPDRQRSQRWAAAAG